mgnify:CR=1 FL=1
MNTFSTTAGIVYLQSQPMLNPYPSPFTAYVLPAVRIGRWVWKEIPSGRTVKTGATDRDVERVGEIYAELAVKDVELAEMGMAAYTDLLDRDLILH